MIYNILIKPYLVRGDDSIKKFILLLEAHSNTNCFSSFYKSLDIYCTKAICSL